MRRQCDPWDLPRNKKSSSNMVSAKMSNMVLTAVLRTPIRTQNFAFGMELSEL